ncbi:MAG: type IX secretion system membrane protein PorP/SprF [Saprospiraceae bacterium]|nr:type IX secretion system membrane protein PorP/SprF [Saprospiraceae bacterium]
MIRFILFFLVLISIHLEGEAQQSALSALQYLDYSRVIGATAGLNGTNIASLTYRDQWSNLPGRPVYYKGGWSSPIKSIGGAYSIHGSVDRIGLQTSTAFRIGYNQVFPTEILLISAGVGLGFDQRSWDGRLIRTPDGIYGSQGFDHKDPNLTLGNMGHQSFELMPSIYVQSKFVEVGFEFGIPFLESSNPVKNVFQKNYTLRTLIFKEFTVSKYVISGQLFVYSDFIKTQSEILLKTEYNGSIFGAVSVRGYDKNSFDAMGLHLGIKVYAKLWLMIGVELPINNLSGQISGLNQDFGLKYVWNAKNSKTRFPVIFNPRW